MRPPNAQGPSRGGGGGGSGSYFGLAAVVGMVAVSFLFPSWLPDFSPEASKLAEGPASRSKTSKANKGKSKLSFDLNKTLERSSKVRGVKLFVLNSKALMQRKGFLRCT